MKKNEINGNIASNQYGWGEYVLYKMYPKSRIAFDGRFETVYSLELHRAYFNLFSGKNGWRELLDKYNTDIALVQKGIPGTAEYLPSYGLLKQESDWVLVYEDDNSAVFIKTNEKNREILARYERNQLLITAQSVVSYFP
jgi:hypothetical protein